MTVGPIHVKACLHSSLLSAQLFHLIQQSGLTKHFLHDCGQPFSANSYYSIIIHFSNTLFPSNDDMCSMDDLRLSHFSSEQGELTDINYKENV